jgi:hypothetical protein
MGLTQVVEQLEANISRKRGEIAHLALEQYTESTQRRHELQAVIQELEQLLVSLKAVLIDEHESRGGFSWITNPDRMGGQFTTDEIDASHRWR